MILQMECIHVDSGSRDADNLKVHIKKPAKFI